MISIHRKERNKICLITGDKKLSSQYVEGIGRRPDRIIGFQETARSNQWDAEIDLVAYHSEMLKSSLFRSTEHPLLSPFLIIEAKKRTGGDCDSQSARPIFDMLQLQENLHTRSKMILPFGIPLVWYISYRGEHWRVSACYISGEPDNTFYVSKRSYYCQKRLLTRFRKLCLSGLGR